MELVKREENKAVGLRSLDVAVMETKVVVAGRYC